MVEFCARAKSKRGKRNDHLLEEDDCRDQGSICT